MKYLLIDGNALAARCNFVPRLKELTTDYGTPSGTIFGFLKNMSYVKNLLKINLQNTIIFWDGGRSKKRMELYPEYKAGRTYNKEDKELTEEEIFDRDSYFHQLQALQVGLSYLEVKQVRVYGTEADDLIGIYSNLYGENNQVIIYSSDHDLHSLVSKNVSIFDPKKELLNEKQILEWWQVQLVDEIILMKAIMGDNSDNIIGVKGIGEVRARMIIDYLEMIDGKLTQVREVDLIKDDNWVQKALASKERIELNYKLVKLPLTWEESLYTTIQAMEAITQLLESGKKIDRKKYIDFLEKWNLQSLLNNLNYL